jgi:hypothetical protein
MGSFVFKWEHAASEVYVTGTFDHWSKSEKLIQTGDVFEKNVTLPSATEKIYYKVRRVTMQTSPRSSNCAANNSTGGAPVFCYAAKWVGSVSKDLLARSENASLWNVTGLYLEIVSWTPGTLFRV